ncbi:MAG TPA: calcium-binding protein [Acidiferrobacteraceae bacterium]|nr:calcium-binding protein [Acidiferrobacteraceae bacterium]HEX20382.1 calcium-binding protein [Acidiferrobacteraceae bacterium]
MLWLAILKGSEWDDTLNGTLQADLIHAGNGPDTVFADAGNDIILGGNGEDSLYGEAGDDTFIVEGSDSEPDLFNGGAGYDQLLGGSGDDTFRIYDFSGANTVELIDGGAGTNVIAGSEWDDTLDFRNTQLLNIAYIDGGNGPDNIWGSNQVDVILGGNGEDSLYGEAGDDTLSGLNGADYLDGSGGNDTLDGGLGNDTYQFNRDGDNDVIQNAATDNSSTTDTVSFGVDISQYQLWFSQENADLNIRIIGTNDSVTLNDWYSQPTSQVDQFTVSIGEALIKSQVEQLVQAMSSFTPPPVGQMELTPEQQNQLNPVIAAAWQ